MDFFKGYWQSLAVGLRTTLKLFLLLNLGVAGASQVRAVGPCSRLFGPTRVLIVDGLSSGRNLAPTITSRPGVRVYHLHSDPAGVPTKVLAPSYEDGHYSPRLQTSYWIQKFRGFFTGVAPRRSYAAGTYAEALEIAKRLNPDAVMVGSESGVVLAEKLRRDLGHRTPISDELIQARQQKYSTAERLGQVGIPVAEQFLSDNVEIALNWVRAHQLLVPGVVLKPPASAGADLVKIVHTELAFREAFERIRSSRNVFGLANEKVLIQEFLEGTEYVVNITSRDRVHKLTDIWQYVKHTMPDGRKLYGHDLLLDSQGEVQDQLFTYVKRAIDALDIDTGWSHVEVMMTPRGPILIEVNNRMMGANQPVIVSKALGTGPIETGIDAFLNEAAFLRLPERYTLKNGVAVVTINAYFSGQKFGGNMVDELQRLPGYQSHTFSYLPGEPVASTDDLLSAIGHVELIDADRLRLQQTIDTIEKWARAGRFTRP